MAKQAFLVDDSKSARIVLGRLLKKNGFDEVAMAESGEQALEQLKNLTPDAIFVDFLMEGMDGLETITELKKNARFANIPMVMCTANEGDRYVQAAVEHGALGILAKPPTDDSLKAIIQLIEEKQEVEEAAPVFADEVVAAPPVLAVDEIRTIAVEAARETAESAAAGIARENADAIAREVARDTVTEMLEPLVATLVDKRLEGIKPPEVDIDSLRGEVVSQVNKELEEFIRQLNERSVESLIEASIYEQVQTLANDFSQRLKNLKAEILAQVPEKNEMIEHIRVVTEGSLEAHVREISTQVSQEVANSIATETVEHIFDEHMADQATDEPAKGSGKLGKLLRWLGLPLVGATAGYVIYALKLFQ
ncbi:MAG: response regulator [Pseudomonadota bacterium]